MGRRVDLDDLIDANEAAIILRLGNRNAVSVYRTRYPDFPKPALERANCVLWLRVDVEKWARERRPQRPGPKPRQP